jgi:N-ethylmaleimide reductase
MADLFSSLRVGALDLPHRIVMAPMTRNRAGEGNAPTASNATYYTQRAGAGLIVTEGSQISAQGQGYPGTPGIHSPEQVAGWKLVTNAVHAKGGRIFLQLWHVGRISFPALQPDGALPVAPSAVKPEGKAWTGRGMEPYVTPHALALSELPDIIEQFHFGARNALAAGFDGVEVHGANGYLLDQFLRDKSNQRSDRYGGSIANRARLLIEVTEAVMDVWGASRVGVRLSPSNPFNDIADGTPADTFGHAVAELNRLDLAYLHLVEPTNDQVAQLGVRLDAAHFRPLWDSALIACTGYNRERAAAVLASGSADLVAFASLYLANPDLPERLRHDVPLNTPDRATFYGGGAKGYIDYPVLGESASATL